MSALDIAARIVQKWEGCRLTAYQDGGGVWTIGWGQTGGDVGPGVVWSQAQADRRLDQTLQSVARGVEESVAVALADNELAALISFAYNIGLDAFAKSTLVRRLNAGQRDEAASMFLRWVYDNGVVVPGLANRRDYERKVFLGQVQP